MIKSQEVLFASGEIRLAGTVIRRDGPGCLPGIVLSHGSGPDTRNGSANQLRDAAEHFARHGFAALIFDKRGVGESTGDWQTADFGELSDDLIEGVRFLRRFESIDPSKVGVWGFSQGGWIAPLAASRCAEVAFVISISPDSGSPAEQDIARVELQMRNSGYTEADINDALTLQEAVRVAIRTQSYESLTPMYNQFSEAEWLDYVIKGRRLPPPDYWYVQWWRKVMDYDPLATLQKVTVPTLIILGEKDDKVRVQKSADEFGRVLSSKNQPASKVLVFTNANHGLRIPGSLEYVAGYFETMTAWVDESLVRNP